MALSVNVLTAIFQCNCYNSMHMTSSLPAPTVSVISVLLCSDTFFIKVAGDGSCVDNSMGKAVDGNPILQWSCSQVCSLQFFDTSQDPQYVHHCA
jgi:hypothetical protein